MLNLKNLFGNKNDEEAKKQGAVQLAPGQHAPGIAGAVAKLFDKNEKEVAKLRPMVERVRSLGPELKALSDDELKQRSLDLKARFKQLVTEKLERQRDPESGEAFGWQELDTEMDWSDEYHRARKAAEAETLDELLPEAFALVREAGDRTIGLRHFDVQLIGGAVLHSGRIGEMRTGEGKTLVATLPAYLNALSGRGVHVITVNDYLAERDANWMRPIYEFLGLTVSFLANDMDNDARKPAYACDILYATNSEVGFDYLRDNMARTADDVVQRPLNYAIVDEVDNILIDEARTPLIISAQVAKTDRALRRQRMATTCDGLARTLMPAVTDREIENLQDSITERGRIDITALMQEILDRGAFQEATSYLIDSYLLSEKSARIENAGHLLDVADEYTEAGLLDDAGRAHLEKIALEAVHPERLRDAWSNEIVRLTRPLAIGWSNAVANNYDARVLAHDLNADTDATVELTARLDEAEDKRAQAAQIFGEEAVGRGLVAESAIGNIAHSLLNSTEDQESVHAALMEAVLAAPGGVQDADAILGDTVAEVNVQTVDGARRVINALEEISLRGLLPFETTEKLWEAVRLTQGRDKLRQEIARAVESHPGQVAQQIATLSDNYATGRETFLATEAQALRGQLSGHENIVKRAQIGAGASELRHALQAELTKSGTYADAIKLAKRFNSDQNKVHQQVASTLAEEMAQWVEVPQNIVPALVELLSEGGKINEVRERILLAVRDLPGENTELPALVTEALRQLQEWRTEQANALSTQINEKVPLPEASSAALVTAVEDGEYSNGIEGFVGETLLTSPQVAAQVEAIDAFGERFEEFKAQSDAKLLQDIHNVLPLSSDAEESLAELLDAPSTSTRLASGLFEELSRDAVSRHLEPLLTEENAPAFAEEVTRRVPLAKEVQKRVKPADFVGRSAEQLARSLVRLVEHSFQIMPVEDFKRVVRNLGWFTEKDEKRRQAALTDMGTLVAEREAGNPVFSDPEGFLETLVSSEILTLEEAAIVRRAQAEYPDESVAALTDRVLRLPAERRRRLSEAKLQEVQSVLDQSIKAHALFHRQVHYMIQGKEILIVDEFTGRAMPGRRFSEGLHEALEAKHGLEVQLESQTVATITIQNYFRLYNKLSGMTGTAKTEEAEFAKTYGIEVVSIPTNRQIQRRDFPDVIYKTQEAKFRAITFEVLEHHCAGQPVLVGTRSVEVSERMSERLKAVPLQTLVLSHLIKSKLWDDKTTPADQKAEIIAALNAPLTQINPAAVKNLAKQHGINPDVTAEDNVNTLLGMFTIPNPSRERLENSLRVGLPHNVLNAKNHRHEARIVAEAARLGAVTIATNMAGRGVDIVLGGTLDVESRWRVMTLQTLARHLEGKVVHVRSRNEETTQKFVDRLLPERLQELAWVISVRQGVEELERNGTIQGSAAKELRDTLSQDLTTPDLKNKVRSRARRLNLVEKLPLDEEATSNRVLDALNSEFSRLINRSFDTAALRQSLEEGVPATASGRDQGELALLEAISRPLSISQVATERLLQTLDTLPNLDVELLRAAGSHADLGYAQASVEIASQLGVVTPEWVEQRLTFLGVGNPQEALTRIDTVPTNQIEINELQLVTALIEANANLGTQWVRERLTSWNVVSDPRAYQGTPEMQELLGDAAVVHLQLDKARVRELLAQWNEGGDAQRALVAVEAPNLVLLGDVADVAGHDAPFLHPEWMHYALGGLGIITDQDVFQAQMMGQAEDEQGNIQTMPIDILVYRLRLDRVLNALFPTLREAVTKVGSEAPSVYAETLRTAPWAEQFIDEAWVAARLEELGVDGEEAAPVGDVSVLIETGVAGQSADIVLEGEARPEDIAHTSEQDEVKQLGGLHIIGTERHESRRIDNQLRGRAGRQGDPGSSRFYVSLEDELWRLFGVRGQALLNKWDEDEAVEHSWISKSVERAQKKVELNHFEGRKHVLQFDDVMNVQREVIYRERRRALLGGNLRETVLDMAQQAAIGEAEKHCPRAIRPDEWDTHKLYLGLSRLFGASLLSRHLGEDELSQLTVRDHMDERLKEVAEACYDERESQMGSDNLRSLERWQVTRTIDDYWMEQLAEMDYLRDAIWQEGYAQKEPIGVYRQEGFALFQKMLGEIRREVTEAIFSAGNDLPIENLLYGGPELSGMQEARLLQMLPMDEDGLDDGVMLQKDADGDDEEALIYAGGADGQNGGNRPLSRAERRAQERGGKKNR